MSVLATVRYLNIPSTSSSAWTALFGFRVRFGGGTLQDQVAPMDTLPVLF